MDLEGINIPEGLDENDIAEALQAYEAWEMQQEPQAEPNPYDSLSSEEKNIQLEEFKRSQVDKDMEMLPVEENISNLNDAANKTKMVGDAATQAASALTVGRMMPGGYLSQASGGTGGDMIGRYISTKMGFRDEVNPEDLLKVDPRKLQTYTDNPAVQNFGIGLLVKTFPAAKAYLTGKSATDEPTTAALKYAEREQMIPTGKADKIAKGGSFGAGTEESVARVAEKAGVSEDGIVDAVGRELGWEAKGTAYERVVANEWKNKGKAVVNSGILEEAKDVPDLITKAGERAKVIYADKVKFLDNIGDAVQVTAKDVSEELIGLTQRIEKLTGTTATKDAFVDGLKSKVNEVIADFSKGGSKNASEVRMYIENLNEYQRKALAAFDVAPQNSKLLGNAGGVDQNAIEAVSDITNALDELLEKRIKSLSTNPKSGIPAEVAEAYSKVNQEYGAYKSIQRLGKKFMSATEEGLTKRNPTAIVQNAGSTPIQQSAISVPTNKTSAISKSIDWLASKFGDPVSETTKRVGQTLDRPVTAMQNIKDLKTINQAGGAALPKPPPYMAAIAAGKLARDISLFTDFPQILSSFASFVDPVSYAQAEEAFAQGTKEEKSRAIANIAVQVPDAFEQVIPGMNSVVNNTIYDDLEKQYASQKLTEVYKNDTAKRLNSKTALTKNQPLPSYAIEALGGTVTREKTPEDSFLEEVEGGQQLQAYTLPSKGSGVTVGTGVDLGNRSVEELRGLGIPEELVIKLSPHLGKKDDRAKQSINRSPLQLTPEEADLLDQKVKGQIKTAIAENYKSETGVDLETLPVEGRTVLYSLAYNFGANLPKKLPTLWSKVVKGDWEGVQKALKTTKWKQPELKDRRLKEAALLESLIPRLPGEEAFSLGNTQLAQLALDDEPVA